MINIIVAVAENRVIGNGGKIPWDIPEDKAYFRKITSGSIVIMGRRTFEEIGRPLPDRYNIIVSGSRNFSGEGLTTAGSLDEAVNIARDYGIRNGIDTVFLCGGEKIYRQGLNIAQRLYITEIKDRYSGDTFFPVFSTEDFRLIEHKDSCDKKLCFCIYERIRKIPEMT